MRAKNQQPSQGERLPVAPVPSADERRPDLENPTALRPEMEHLADNTSASTLAENRQRLHIGPDIDASLQLLETALTAGSAGFAYLDRNIRIVRINDALARMNGRTEDELSGRQVSEILAAQVWETVSPAIMLALAGHATVDMIYARDAGESPPSGAGVNQGSSPSHFARGGEVRIGEGHESEVDAGPVDLGSADLGYGAYGAPVQHVQASYFPAIADDRVVGVVVVVKDITDQFMAAQSLRQSASRASTMAEAAMQQAHFEKTQRFLAELGIRIRTAQDSDELIWRAVSDLGKQMDVSRCLYGELDAAGDHVTVYKDYCARVPSIAGTFTREAVGDPVLTQLAEGRTVVLTDTETDPRTRDQFDRVFKPLQIMSSINVPLMSDGRQVATFSVMQNTPRRWTEDDIALVETVADRTWFAAENARLKRRTLQVEARQRIFLRDILASVTEGRLHLCQTPSDLPKRLPQVGPDMDLINSNDLAPVRHAVRDLTAELSFPQLRATDLVTSTGEAAMNAVVHAARGRAIIGTDNKDTIQVWISDQGKGIPVEDLPQATLSRGFSTTHTLGHGFKIMLHTTDRVYLLTSPDGTTVVLEQDRVEPEPKW